MRRFGLVLGAGGGTGRAFHAGALAALQDVTGIDARDAAVIAGTSAGSLDGAFLRAGVAPRDLLARISGAAVSPEAATIFDPLPAWIDPDEHVPAAAWRPASVERLRAAARRPWTLSPHAMGTLFAAVMPEGRRSTQLIADIVAALHPHGWPRTPYWVTAVRLDDGTRVVFGRDAKAAPGDAVAASCAIPGYFAPVRIGGARYVDGGAHSPSNADLVAPLHLDLVVVSSPMTATPRALRPSGDSAFRAACRVLLRREVSRLRRAGAQVVVLEPTTADLAAMGSVTQSMSPWRRRTAAEHVYESVAARLRSGPVSAVFETALA